MLAAGEGPSTNLDLDVTGSDVDAVGRVEGDVACRAAVEHSSSASSSSLRLRHCAGGCADHLHTESEVVLVLWLGVGALLQLGKDGVDGCLDVWARARLLASGGVLLFVPIRPPMFCKTDILEMSRLTTVLALGTVA